MCRISCSCNSHSCDMIWRAIQRLLSAPCSSLSGSVRLLHSPAPWPAQAQPELHMCCRCAHIACTRTWLAGVGSQATNIPAPQTTVHEFALHVSTQGLSSSYRIESCGVLVGLKLKRAVQDTSAHRDDGFRTSQTMRNIRQATVLAFSLASSADNPSASASFFAL